MQSRALQEALLDWYSAAIPAGRGGNAQIWVTRGSETAFLALRNGAVVAEGPELFDGGCLQDILLSVLVAELCEKGLLTPEDPIGKHLPELMCGGFPGAQIQIQDLMSHASGYWPPRGANVGLLTQWTALTDFLTSSQPVFPRGTVVIGSLLERAILVRLLTRVLGADVYRHIEATLLRSLPGVHFAPPPYASGSELEELRVDMPSMGQLLQACWRTQWARHVALPTSSHTVPIVRGAEPTKDFVPMRATWGVLRYQGPLAGQNGMSLSTFTGVRFDASAEALVAGAFSSRLVRDFLLNVIFRQLGYGCYPLRSSIVGHLGTFRAEELTGVYEGADSALLHVQVSRGCLDLEWRTDKTTGRFTCRIEDDETLHATGLASVWPSLWIEPFRAPASSDTCLMVGTGAFRKI